VELGANDGVNSNTHLLEQQGWAGFCIEANPTTYALLTQNRQQCQNRNFAVGPNEEQLVFRHFEGKLYGHSGFRHTRTDAMWQELMNAWKDSAATMKDINVTSIPISRFFSDEQITTIDFFSLDVEGLEMAVLTHFPWKQVVVKVWAVETNKLNHRMFNSLMHSHGYLCRPHDAVNTICILQTHISVI
jgi:FkbM family methyltransferase